MHSIIKLALQEDAIARDITSLASFGKKGGLRTGILRAKQRLCLSGLAVAQEIFKTVSPKIKLKTFYQDGQSVPKNKIIASVSGDVYDLLRAERTALNFLQQLSGVATLTRQFVEQIKPHRAQLLDTRKTLPGLRTLQKQAVVHGGGHNHRLNLADQFLIKDNHIEACGGIIPAIERARKFAPKRLIEVETKNLAELRAALEAKADIILLDNMSLKQIRQAVLLAKNGALLEVSGGVNLKTIKKIAATGVARISVGALTHSAPAVDISFDL